MGNKKRFEDYLSQCDECEMYYTNRCDSGNSGLTNEKQGCKSFLPIRNVTIPNAIERLQREFKWLVVLQTFSIVIALIEIARWIG